MSRYIGNYLRVPSSEPQQASAPGIWSISEQLAYQRANLWPPARDPYYNQTVLHLSGDVAATRETNPVTQPRTFLSDASTNNFLLIPNGDVSARSFNPYMGSNYSTYFDGIDDALTVAGNAALDLTGDFTIEFWANMQGNTNYLCNGTQSGSGCWRLTVTASTGTAQFDMAIGSWAGLNLTSAAGLFTKNVWTHFAITRSASTFRLFINGVPVAIATNSGSLVNTGRATQIGYYTESSGTYYSQWYLSNLRIIKGTALYTTGFTPSSIPLTAITNTSLLTCQSNRLIDTSSNNFTVTPSSTPVVAQNSPFVEYDTTSGSGYFDGTDDYFTVGTTASNAFAFSGDFTIETWFYKPGNGSDTYEILLSVGDGNAVNGFFLELDDTRSLAPRLYMNNGALVLDGYVSSKINDAQWHHIACVRSGSNCAMFYDGTRVATSTSSASLVSSASPLYIGRIANSTVSDFYGYVSDVRIINGTAAYNPTLTTITVPTRPLTAVANTSLLTLQTRAPANNQGILDSSPNSFVVTRNGNVAQGSFSPFSQSGWSNYFLGRLGTNLNLASNAGLAVGAGQFCVEAWVYVLPQTLTSTGYGYGTIISQGNNNNNNMWWLAVNDSTGAINWGYTGSGVTASTSYPVVKNTWTHLAVTRDASNGERIFLNGVLVNHRTNTTNYSSVNGYQMQIGTGYDSNYPSAYGISAYANPFSGYISNLRVITGSIPSIYQTSTTTLGTNVFTPPVSDLTAVAGTILLTCQNNRFKDSSPNNWTISKSGSDIISVQPFSPFAPTQAYVASQLGGSAYFDASGDSIAITSSIVNPSGTEDFTLEFWFYHTMSSWPGGFLYYLTGTGSSTFGIYYNNVQNEIVVQKSGVTQIINTAVSNTPLNQWNHYTLVRSSNSWAVWINGTRTNGPITNSTSFNAATGFSISPTNAYVSGFRIVKQPLYLTSQPTIPVPTAPPQAINNTTTLLNFTGAGIVDSTGKNVVETVGNSAVQTTQSKWPPGSMYFDGNGDYLQCPISNIWDFGTGDFTVEIWVYYSTASRNGSLVSYGGYGFASADSAGWSIQINATYGSLFFNTGATQNLFISSNNTLINSTLPNNQWNHVAAARQGTNLRLYVNGSQVGNTFTNSVSCSGSSYTPKIACDQAAAASSLITGYLNDIRITKGYARYVTGTGANANQMVFNGTNTLALPTGPFPLA